MSHTPHSAPHPSHEINATPTDKARLRWQQRGNPTLTLTEALHESYYVGVDRLSVPYDKVRFHPPTETLIVIYQNHINTVLNVSDEYGDEITGADHLITCNECDLEFQPSHSHNDCPWCGASR